MRVLHVTPAFYPATYWGGPIFSVYGLCNALAETTKLEIRVLTTDSAGPTLCEKVKVANFPEVYPGGYKVYFCRRWYAASVSPGMLARLWPMIAWADVVHLTGVYSPPTLFTLLICRVLNKPIVWSPRGAFQRWGGTTRPLIKTIWERAANRLIKKGACLLHVTSDIEAKNSQERIPKAAVGIIPNGVVLPSELPDREWLPNNIIRLLYIGRLHPIKGLENLLYALARIKNVSFSLIIAGTGENGYVLKIKSLMHELNLDKQIVFRGHIDGKVKLNEFMRADVCVVPSYTENFGMVVAESLACGVPVIASNATPWSALEKKGCGMWVENSPDKISEAIMLIMQEDLRLMGARGRSWMEKDYSWQNIAKKMEKTYLNISGIAGS